MSLCQTWNFSLNYQLFGNNGWENYLFNKKLIYKPIKFDDKSF